MAASIQLKEDIYKGEGNVRRVVLTVESASGLPKEIFIVSDDNDIVSFLAVADASQIQNLTTDSQDDLYRVASIDLTLSHPDIVTTFLKELKFDIKLLLRDIDAIDTLEESITTTITSADTLQ